MNKDKIYFAILLFFIANLSQAQQAPLLQFQERNTTTLVLNESALPPKKYDLTNSDLQVKWHLIILDLIEQTTGYTPNVAARSMAYIDLAAYESILPAYPHLKSLSGQLQGFIKPQEYEIDSTDFIPQLALNNAMYKTVDRFFIAAPYVWMEKVIALKDSVDDIFSKDQSNLAIMKSKNYGISIADMVLKYAEKDRAGDGTFRSYDMDYRLPVCESCFEINRVADLENTGPLHPRWSDNRTFLEENNTDFDIKPDFEFSKYPGSEFYKAAMEVYNTSKEVTAGSEKHIIANFWDDAATYTYTAVGHSVSILTQVLRNKPVSLDSSAKYYAMLTLGLNDALICAWKGKYKYNLIRPIAYIKRYIDSKWEPTLLTPPFPEFPSGHSVQSATMATVLTSVLGDSISFTDYSKYWVGEPKKFESFWKAANETSISRLYGGIHYMQALTKGQEMGKRVGENILKLKFEKE
ncbi:phosphatase PAP2 family protein [Lacihabitans sp. LS3-19]|uniref:vanadium-dependent haloperoxidase n=1 Tax=Lacihabitans sp. LS3-19 TaxID=2487335 RepID=UPI0020CC59D9|nr:vanadium-dependent haloperoxidase [Lacihabitans sp. LS3-19]MCP9768471.1 phosphatase PAP2 family protein [Lacihabitans sp. LS3-19]